MTRPPAHRPLPTDTPAGPVQPRDPVPGAEAAPIACLPYDWAIANKRLNAVYLMVLAAMAVLGFLLRPPLWLTVVIAVGAILPLVVADWIVSRRRIGRRRG